MIVLKSADMSSPTKKASVRLLVAKRKRFPRVATVPYMLWWHCYIERYNQC